jgi:hypothetical protein
MNHVSAILKKLEKGWRCTTPARLFIDQLVSVNVDFWLALVIRQLPSIRKDRPLIEA